MHRVLLIESMRHGLLTVNGQFCGPLEGEGQAFPMGGNAEVYIQFHPYGSSMPLAAALEMRAGRLVRLEPQESCFALIWPDGVIQLEIRLDGDERQDTRAGEAIVPDALLRYLTLRLAGDEQAQHLLMQGCPGIETGTYSAAVPLRFAPFHADERFDQRAGMIRRVLPNAAVVDAVFASTVPAGAGRRMIERIEVTQTAT